MMAAQSISFVNPIDPIGQQLALQQAQKQQDIADALRKQSFDAIPDNGGNVSWTQGIAKIAQALAANHLQRSSMAQQYGVAQQGMDAMRGGFGLPPIDHAPNPYSTDETGRNFGQRVGDFVRGGPPVNANVAKVAAALGSQAAPQPAGAPPMGAGGGMPPPSPQPNPAPSAPVMPGGQPGFTDAMSAAINPPAPQPASAPAMPPPNPAGVATVAGALSGQPPAAPARGPMSLSGNPQQDMYDYVTDRAEYTKALIASHAPVDIAKMMQQAGIDPNSPIGHQILQQNIAKQNYIAPIAMRPGGSVADPNDPSRILSVAPQAINGANPVLDSSGRFTGGYSAAPGAQSIEAGMAGAKAGAEAYGKAQFEPQTVVNPDGSSGVVSRAAALAPGGSGGAPGGSLNGHYGAGGASGGPVTTALSPARSAAMTTTGKASGDMFTGYQADAAASRDRTYQLGELQKINNGTTQFGPGAEQRSHVYGVLNTIGQSLGLPNSLVAQGKTTIDTAEFQKFSSQLVAASASKLGIPTDAKMQLLASSMGSLDKPNAANAKVFDYLLGNEAALRGKADAAASWTQHNGPETAPQFEIAFRQALDPRVYQVMSLPAPARAAAIRQMAPADRSALASSYDRLHALGAIQ